MADLVQSCELDPDVFEAEHSADFEGESMNMRYKVQLKTSVALTTLQLYNSHKILYECNLVNPTEFPTRGGVWPVDPLYGWYALKFHLARVEKRRRQLTCDITFGPVPPSSPNTDGAEGNPLFFPAVYDVEYIEQEEAVTEAYNMEAIGGSSLAGNRPVGTLGPVVNGALQEPDEGIIDVVNEPVLVITKNVATLGDIISLNNGFLRTTNTDDYFGAAPGTAKFLGAISGGQQVSNGFSYYRMTVRVQIKKSVLFTMNNVGFHYWKLVAGVKTLVKFQVADPNTPTEFTDASEPRFLEPGGGSSEAANSLHYRYLRPTSYVGLML